MEITFDPVKREATLRERGLDFADASVVFSGRYTLAEDTRFAYPERRFISAGRLNGRIVVMVWTPTNSGRRIISMRRCHAKEQDRWRNALDGP